MVAASFYGMMFNVAIVGGIFAILGQVVDKLIVQANILALPQDALNTVWYLSLCFYIGAFLWFIAQLISYWIEAKSEYTRLV
jgi:hypothetical protein